MKYKKFYSVLKDKGLSVNKAASLCGIHSQSIYTALKGKSPLYPGWRNRLADLLEVPVEELFPEEEERGQA